MYFKDAAALASFSPEKMTKTTLAKGDHLFVGLNSFEPGQEHALHAHEGQDKLYVVLHGEGDVRIGDTSQRLGPGGAAFAPSGVVHSIRNEGSDRLVVMAILGPPPQK